MEQQNDTQAAISAGMALATLKQTESGIPLAILPDGAHVQILDHLMSEPPRRKGKVALHDTDSFIKYVILERTAETRIYATSEPPSFTAVFNDGPGWKDHRTIYACPVSKEWGIWSGQNGKAMSQEQFAQFIENNLPDVANPPAAEMLEISRSLEAKKKVNFAAGIRLSNGQNELTYEEEISGTAAKGKLQVPEIFTIGIPVFENGERYAVNARLRYRIADGGKLSMWYELVRPHKILEDALANVRKQIAEQTTVPIFNGSI